MHVIQRSRVGARIAVSWVPPVGLASRLREAKPTGAGRGLTFTNRLEVGKRDTSRLQWTIKDNRRIVRRRKDRYDSRIVSVSRE